MMLVFTCLLFAGLGAVGWSFTEYAMHHWNGHLMRGKTRFSREHLAHHTKQDYFAPLHHKVIIAVVVTGAIAAIASWLAGPGPGIAFAVGFGGTYLGYEILHYRIHFYPPRGPFGRWARKHHFSHHFNSAKRNHGVTSPVWDRVFGTYTAYDTVRVPRKLAMRWLIDPATDECHEAYRADYTLIGRRRPEAISEASKVISRAEPSRA